jgi:FkbM family methyltransferase
MRFTSVNVGNDRILLRSRSGYKMFVDARDVSITPHLILDGVYEEHTDAALRALVKPGMNVLEIGANVGLFTMLMSHRVGRGGSVLSFECDPVLAQILRDNVEINGFAEICTVDERAVTDSEGVLSFYTAERHRGGGTLIEGLEQIPQLTSSERRRIDVRTTTIDAILADHPAGFDFVKVDAEGAEPAIVSGGQKLLADTSRPLVFMMEFSPKFVQKGGVDPRAQLSQLASYGFRFARVDERRRKVVSTTADELLGRDFSDVVMTRG